MVFGQEPAPSPGGQQEPVPSKVPVGSTAGFSPEGLMYWGPEGTDRPEASAVALATMHANEKIAQIRRLEEIDQAEKAYNAEIVGVGNAWLDHHSRAIMGGVVGAEDALVNSIYPVAEGFAAHGLDYYAQLDADIRYRAKEDIEEWSEQAGFEVGGFQDTDPEGAFPRYRIPSEALKGDGWRNLAPGLYEWTGAEQGQRHGMVWDDGTGGLPVSFMTEGEVASGPGKAVRGLEGFEEGKESAKISTRHMRTLTRYEGDQYKERGRKMLQGMSLDQAIEAQKAEVPEHAKFYDVGGSGAGNFVQTVSFGLWSSPQLKRSQRQREYLGDAGERRAGITGTLLGFVNPGGAPARMFTLGRNTGKAGFAKLTAKVSDKARQGFLYRAGKFAAQAEGAVLGGLVWEKLRAHDGVEQHMVDELARHYVGQGLGEEEAAAEAHAEFAAQQLDGSLKVFRLVEYSQPIVGRLMRGLARGTRKGAETAWRMGERARGKTPPAEGSRLALKRSIAGDRFEAVMSAAGTGGAIGAGLGMVDPTVRKAFGDWMKSGFQDEEAWDVLVEGSLIGAAVFGLHGGLQALTGFHTQLKARFDSAKARARMGEEAGVPQEIPGRPDLDIPPWMTTEKIAAREGRLWEKVYELENLIDSQMRAHEGYAAHRAEAKRVADEGYAESVKPPSALEVLEDVMHQAGRPVKEGETPMERMKRAFEETKDIAPEAAVKEVERELKRAEDAGVEPRADAGTPAPKGRSEVVETKDVSIQTEMVRPEELRVEGERFQRERAGLDDVVNQVDSSRSMFRERWSESEYAMDPILAVRNRDGSLTVVAGHHRRARALGLHGSPNRAPEKIPVRVIRGREGTGFEAVEAFAREAAVKTNVVGKKLTRLELMDTVQELRDAGSTLNEIRAKTGVSAGEVRKILDLASLPKEVLQGVREGWVDENKVARLGESMRRFPKLWNGDAIQRYVTKNAKALEDQTATAFSDNIAQIERRFMIEMQSQAQGVFPGMERTEAQIANVAIEMGTKRSKLLSDLAAEQREDQRTIRKYEGSKEERHLNKVAQAKRSLVEVEKRLEEFDRAAGLGEKEGSAEFFPEDPAGFADPIVLDKTPNMFESRLVKVEPEGVSHKDMPAVSESVKQHQAKAGEKEIAGILGVDAKGEPVAVPMGLGDANSVALNARDLIDKAGAQGISEIIGVFHTHPKGQDISTADRRAARAMEDRFGVKLYMHDGKDLVKVEPADQRSLTEEVFDSITLGEARVERALKKAKGAKAEELQTMLKALRNDRAQLEAATGTAEAGNVFEALHKKYLDQGYAQMESVLLEAGMKPINKLLSWFVRPDIALQEKAYRGTTADMKKARGLNATWRMAKTLVPEPVYTKMRAAASRVRVRMDTLQKVLYGRDLKSGPLGSVERNSRSAWRIAAALDGMTVKDWNGRTDATGRHGRIEGDPALDMREILTPAERQSYDVLEANLKGLKRVLFEHIKRFEIRDLKRAEADLKLRVEMLKGRIEDMAYESPTTQRLQMAKAAKQLERLQVSLGRARSMLSSYRRGVDPHTGQEWGFSRYFHHVHTEGFSGPNAAYDALHPLVQKRLKKEVFASYLQKRSGSEDWSLDLHHMFDVYVPSVVHKVEMDKMLDVANLEIHGRRRAARSLSDLGQPWHTQMNGQSLEMAIERVEHGKTQRYFSLPKTLRLNEEGVPQSMLIRNIGTGQDFRVYGSKTAAKEAGEPGGLTVKDFKVRDGGLASSWAQRKGWTNRDVSDTIDYTKDWIERSLGRHKDFGPVWEGVRHLTRKLTGMEYHAYIGAFYPKAAVTNIAFGTLQTLAEIGPEYTTKGYRALAHLQSKPAGKGDRLARHYHKVLRRSGVLEDSFVGFQEFTGRGISPPQTAHAKFSKAVNDISFGPFKWSEKQVRAATYLGAYLKAKDAGRSEKSANLYALDVISHTQFDMGVYAAPRVVEHPLGYGVIMLRRFALNMAGLAVRGYAGGAKAATGVVKEKALESRKAFAEKHGFDPLKALMGEKRNLTEVEVKTIEREVADLKSARHIADAARLSRLAVYGGLMVWMYKQLTGRDPRVQYASTLEEIPVVENMHFLTGGGPVSKSLMSMPVPGITGPFDPAPLPWKFVSAGVEGMMGWMNGDEFAMRDTAEDIRPMWMSRTGANLYHLITAEAVGEEGNVLVRKHGKAHYETTRGELFKNLFLPGTPVELQDQWKAAGVARSESQLRRNQRKTYNRLLLSDDPKDVDRGIAMGVEHGFIPNLRSWQQALILKEATVAVRRIMTGVDKTDRVQIAARYLPSYSEEELGYAMYLLGMHEPEWWMGPNGMPSVTPEALQLLSDAFEAREKK